MSITCETTVPSNSARLAEQNCVITVNASGKVEGSDDKFWTADNLKFKLKKNKFTKGFFEGCLGMRVGETRRVDVPAAKAYGSSGNKKFGVPKNSAISYTIELLDIKQTLPNIPLKFTPASGDAVPKGTVLFCHGWPDDGDDFQRQVDFLKEENYNCLTYTLPWFGDKKEAKAIAKEQGYKKKGYTHQELVDGVAEKLVEHLEKVNGADQEIEKVTILGHDWGCLHAQMMKVRHPHLIKNSIILDVDGLIAFETATVSKIITFVFLGLYYQYWMMLGFWFSTKGMTTIGEWYSRRTGRRLKGYLSKILKKRGEPKVNHKTTGNQGYVFVELHREFYHKLVGVRPKMWKDKSVNLHADTMYVFGTQKPFQLHGPGMAKKLNSEREDMVNSCAVAMKCKHWIHVEMPDELNANIKAYLEDRDSFVKEAKSWAGKVKVEK